MNRQAHADARKYFEALPAPDQIDKLQDLEPLIELCRHMAAAGDLEEAWWVYWGRLSDHLMNRFASHRQAKELLLPLFTDGLDRPPRLASAASQGTACNELGICFSYAGDPATAMSLREKAADLWTDKTDQAIALGNLAANARQTGQLRRAQALAAECLDLWASSSEFRRAQGHETMAEILMTVGAWDAALLQVNRAAALWPKARQEIPWLPATDSLRARLVLAGQGGDAVALAESQLRRAEAARLESFLIEALVLRAEAGLASEWPRPGRATHDAAHSALRRARDGGFVPHECDALVPWALVQGGQGRIADGLADAAAAIALAERCTYRLKLADAHLAAARLHLLADAPDRALPHARAARAAARCDGPPDHTYRLVWDRSGEVLRHLGEPPAD